MIGLVPGSSQGSRSGAFGYEPPVVATCKPRGSYRVRLGKVYLYGLVFSFSKSGGKVREILIEK